MSGDLISRQAAIDALVKQTHLTWEHLKITYPMLNVLEKLPSAERREVQSSECEYWDDESNFCTLYRPSAERNGRWENDGHTLACSNCHTINIRGVAWDYCPYCGAAMIEEEEA